MGRITRIQYYSEITQAVSRRADCLRRKVGAIIVNEGRIVTTGYNGPPPNYPSCAVCNKNWAPEDKTRDDSESLKRCPAVHAEVNALLQAAKYGTPIKGGTMYCTLQPCYECLKMIVNAGIVEVRYCKVYEPTNPELYYDIASQAGVALILEHNMSGVEKYRPQDVEMIIDRFKKEK